MILFLTFIISYLVIGVLFTIIVNKVTRLDGKSGVYFWPLILIFSAFIGIDYILEKIFTKLKIPFGNETNRNDVTFD